jgi:hypothetical protein
MMPPITAQVA